MGMFSLIDGIMDRPIEEVLEKIPIESDIKDALLGKEGRLRDIYQLILSYEKGDWEAIPPLHEKLRLDEEGIAAFYLEAVDMANQSFKGAN